MANQSVVCLLLLVVVCSLSWAAIIQDAEEEDSHLGVAVGRSNDQMEDEANECLICDPFACPDLKKCNAGVVRDRCGCCDVCAVEEGHLCNIKPYQPGKSQLDLGGNPQMVARTGMVMNVWYGHCGVDLECRERTDVDFDLVGRQSVCYCVKPDLVCGSDKHTYSWCRMKEMEIATDNKTHMISHGPCKTEPKIISIAQSQIVPGNSRISLLCEVEGYPTPSVIWYHISPGSEEPVKLPGDSDEISVSFRGGPQPMRISSHLQIMHFSTKNEGKYRCFADNDMGMTVKEFSLVKGVDEIDWKSKQ